MLTSMSRRRLARGLLQLVLNSKYNQISVLTKQLKRQRRISKIRAKISGTDKRPRLAVFRSLKHINAQLIDDISGRTLLSVNDQKLEKKGTKTEVAAILGKELAKAAVAAGIKEIVFDRRGFCYHGRIKALADAARDIGLKF